MILKSRHLATLFCWLCIASCGGGGEDSTTKTLATLQGQIDSLGTVLRIHSIAATKSGFNGLNIVLSTEKGGAKDADIQESEQQFTLRVVYILQIQLDY